MKKHIVIASLLSLLTLSAHAECDAQKAARNSALDKSVGVSGFCTPKKAAKNGVADNTQLDEAKDKIDKKVDNVKDKSSSLTLTAGDIKDVVAR
ncbi:MAG TPA: hypothetical protein VGI71_08075 [Scandinavium sp.]|jgi:peptidoglycan hydrolase CwlO-like protein